MISSPSAPGESYIPPDPLRAALAKLLLEHLTVGFAVEPRAGVCERIAEDLLEHIAKQTPAEMIEEGTYLLGGCHLWSDTQGTKATEHLVRRIVAPDHVVRSRMERELRMALEVLKSLIEANVSYRRYEEHPGLDPKRLHRGRAWDQMRRATEKGQKILARDFS